jgi:tight adherence protein C
MSASTVLAIGVSALVAAIMLAVLALAVPRTSARQRVTRGLAAIESYGRAPAAAEPGEPAELALPSLLTRLRAVGALLSPSTVTASLARRLDVAGNPGRWTVEKMLAAKGFGLLAAGTLGLLAGLGSPVKMLLFGGLGAAAGFGLPDLLLYNTGSKRQVEIRKELPDTLDMLTVCVEAGLGFDAAVSRVGQHTAGPLAAELLRMLHEMQLGMSRVEALRALAERTTAAELRAFTSALVQATELGIPTGRVLREQASEMRLKQRQLAEEKAQKLPVKILFPLMFCIFPALFVVVLGPAAISMLRTLGH